VEELVLVEFVAVVRRDGASGVEGRGRVEPGRNCECRVERRGWRICGVREAFKFSLSPVPDPYNPLDDLLSCTCPSVPQNLVRKSVK